MRARQPRLHRIIGLSLSLMSFVFSSLGQSGTLASRSAPTQFKNLTWNTLYIIGPGVGGNSYGAPEMPARLTAIDLTTGRERLVLSSVYDAKLSSNGSLLYVASLSQPHIAAFDTATRRERWQVSLKEFEGYTNIGTDFGASPDDLFVYIPTYYGGNDSRPPRLRVVDVMRRMELPVTIQLPMYCQGDVLTPTTGNFVYIHCSNKLILINTKTQAIQHEYKLNLQEPVRALIFSPDGQWLYLFIGTNGLAIFDTAQRRVVQQLSLEPNPSLLNPQYSNTGVLLAPSADGKRLLVAQSFYEWQSETEYRQAACLFRIFDTRTWRNVAKFKSSYPVYTVAVNAKGDVLYAAIAKRTRTNVGKLVVPNTVVELSADSGRIRRQFVRENENISRILVGP
jgi:WD40 repeat protein